MKGKTRSNQPQKKINLKSSTSNLFLNLIITVLGIVIIFMAYSLYNKISDNGNFSSNSTSVENRILQIEVLNGCGVSGIADKMTDYLRKNNFDVVQVGNYTSFDMDKSLVIDRTGNKTNAEKIATALGINKKNIVQQINSDYFLDCSVVIGKDYFQLKPFN
ncbi:MAG TPA: LytR C-terminal domain-containing protein [Ignavibacteriaceae bacterium]|nr:LytR C-terminal domain-containing protein [Ignavibacteriaceae bacterium]